jgi:hypothetical protein
MQHHLHEPRGALVLFTTLNRRQKMARRRVAIVSSVAALALVSWIVGALSGPHGPDAPSAAFTYFPSE